MVVERRVENRVNVYTSARNNRTQNFMLPKFYVFFRATKSHGIGLADFCGKITL